MPRPGPQPLHLARRVAMEAFIVGILAWAALSAFVGAAMIWLAGRGQR